MVPSADHHERLPLHMTSCREKDIEEREKKEKEQQLLRKKKEEDRKANEDDYKRALANEAYQIWLEMKVTFASRIDAS